MPTIARFVSGVECIKRINIIGGEDVAFEAKHHKSIAKLACISFLAQSINKWKPSLELVLDVLPVVCEIAMCSTHYFDYNLKVDDTFENEYGGIELVVTAIDSVDLLNGERRLRLTLNCGAEFYWIENLGSTLGLLSS